MVASKPLPTPWQAIEALRRAGIAEEWLVPIVAEIDAKPGDLMTLADASKQFSIPYGTLGRWISLGRVTAYEGDPHPGPGGRKVLVSATEVDHYRKNPLPGGRPRGSKTKNETTNN